MELNAYGTKRTWNKRDMTAVSGERLDCKGTPKGLPLLVELLDLELKREERSTN